MNLKTLYQNFLKSEESTWVMEYPNAVDLYKFIMEHPIKKVLGLGTGVGLSDAVIALAWKDKGEKDVKLDTIEQYDKCIKLAKELIPKELQEHIVFHKSEATIWALDKIPYQYFSVYKELPEDNYDLIVNDGPAPFVDEGNNFVELPNGVVPKMTLEDKIAPGKFVIYDGRIPALKLLERFFASCYYLYKVPKGRSDFFVMQRKATPAEVEDTKYESMKNRTIYFKNHEKNTVPINKQSSSGKTAETPAKVEKK